VGSHAQGNPTTLAYTIMLIDQIIEIDSGNYRVEATLTPDEMEFLVSVAFSYLLKAGSVDFITKLLGEHGAVTMLNPTHKVLQ
jgi:hypothetical protein